MIKSLSTISFVLLLTLGGCGDGNNPLPEETERPLTPGPVGDDPGDFEGRIIAEQPIQDATLWLDINSNYQWDSDEPRATSDPDGRYIFSSAAVAAFGSPRQYPLVAHALPGVSSIAGNPVERGFFLTAPPGSTAVTPLTTLIMAESAVLARDGTASTYGDAHDRLRVRTALSEPDLTINFQQDYIALPEGANVQSLAMAYLQALQNLLAVNFSVTSGLLTELDRQMVLASQAALLKSSKTIMEAVYPLASPSDEGADADQEDPERTTVNLTGSDPVLQLQVELDNPEVLFQVLRYTSANSSSVQVEDQLRNTTFLYPIPTSERIQPEQSSPVLGTPLAPSAFLSNTQLNSITEYHYQTDASLEELRLDGGTDLLFKPVSSSQVVTDTRFDPFSTELLRADGDWDLISRISLSEEQVPILELEEPDNGELTEINQLLTKSAVVIAFDDDLLLGTSSVSQSFGSISGSLLLAQRYQFEQFQGAQRLIQFDLETGYDRLMEFSCYSGAQLTAIYVVDSTPAVSPCISPPPEFYMVGRYYGLENGLAARCYQYPALSSGIYCEIPVADQLGRVDYTVIEKRITSGLPEEFTYSGPDQSEVIGITDYTYRPLSDAMYLDLDTEE